MTNSSRYIESEQKSARPGQATSGAVNTKPAKAAERRGPAYEVRADGKNGDEGKPGKEEAQRAEVG